MSEDPIILNLIVQRSARCKDVLKYLDKNIIAVNQCGAIIKIKKINIDEVDKEVVEAFRKEGITRLPALIPPDGKPIIGLKEVIDLFEKNINPKQKNSSSNEYGGPAKGAEFGSNPDLEAFYRRELFNGMDSDGYMIPRNDPDEGEDNGSNLERRMAEYRRREPPHRRQDGRRERNVNRQDNNRRNRDRDNYDDYDEPEDNIETEEPPAKTNRNRGPAAPDARLPRMEPTEDGRGDDMDQRMMAAWMDNNDG